METIYWICAVVGGTLIVCQFVLTLMGLGGDHDVDTTGADVHADMGGHDGVGHHDGVHGHGATTLLFGVLTFRTIVAGLAFFGLTGLALMNNNYEPTTTFLGALAAGLVAVIIVAWVMRSLNKLNIDGTVRIQKAVGATGTVYLSIPAVNEGVGKVHVTVQNQLKEYRAVSSGGPLPTGSKVVILKVIGSDTVEVCPVESLETSAKV
jgi:membrane protein implicated in regulation of membrane protease activity